MVENEEQPQNSSKSIKVLTVRARKSNPRLKLHKLEG